ncbi:MAG TPA: PAS domain S-box protein, partial [Myxococcota bacterium]|nr:PAS domain S-box protein [Myxococcota bacterium]
MANGAPDGSASADPCVAAGPASSNPEGPCRDLLRTVIDHVPAFLALTDADGRYVIANRMYTQAFGVRPDELEGRLWHEVFPDLIPVHKPLIDRAMDGETVVFDDVVARDPAHPIHVHGHYRPLFDASGKVAFMSVVAMDITERVAAEAALRASEERLRLVNQAMDEAIGIRDGATFRVYFMNPAYERLYGVPREELENDPLATVRAVHPEDRDAFVRWLQERRETRVGSEIEYRVVLPNGEVRWLWASGQPVLADDGSVRLWITSSRDVTARRRAEAALAAEKELLSAALRGIADGVIATDRQGRIELMNPVAETTTGWDRQEAMGRPLDGVFRVSDEPPGGGADAAGAAHRTLLPRRGGPLPVTVRRTPMRDPEGEAVGEVVVFHDATEDLRREEELIKTQKLESLAVLAGGIAHDFNNLLTGIQGNLSLALCGEALPEGLRGWLSDAQAAGDRARGLTQQLLTFARGGEPVRKPTDLGRTIRQAAAFSRVGSSVSCRVDVADGLWTVD